MSDALISSGTPASVPTLFSSLLPSGSKLQAGTTSTATADFSFVVVFPVPYTSFSSVQTIMCTAQVLSGIDQTRINCVIVNQSATGFTVTADTDGSAPYQVNWLAIGV